MRELLSQKRVLNIAHRGFTADAPENSLKAFEQAIALGVDGIELDVRTCKTGEVVVFHDAKLDRMTAADGLVKQTPLSGLRDLRLVQNGKETDQRIPLLQEVLELTGDKLLVNIEIKATGLPAKHSIEEKVLDICRELGLMQKTIISSFHPLIVRKLRKLDDRVTNGFIIDKNFRVGNSRLFFSKMAAARAIHPERTLLNPVLTQKIAEHGFLCFVWTVNEPTDMLQLIDWGVHGIITDRPDILMEQMIKIVT